MSDDNEKKASEQRIRDWLAGLRALSILIVLLMGIAACSSPETEPTGTASADQAPSPVVPIPSAEPTPTPVVQETAALPEATATLEVEATPTPSPTVPLPDLPAELTAGADALVSCAGRTVEHWLENGPPPMTAKLVECLQLYLEENVQ